MKVGVVGAGTMGLGIAHAFAINDVEVALCEPFAESRDRARKTLDEVVASGVEREKLTAESAQRALDLVEFVGDISKIPEGCDVIIESVTEQAHVKKQVLVEIESRRPLIIGSNTSSLSIDSLAAALKDPSRFLGFHFFNPVWSKTLVEMVVGMATSAATLERAIVIASVIRKDTIVVKDSPGFATSRLGLILGLEAIRLLESGIASAQDIDRAMTQGYGHPMGPLRLTDLVGLDVRLDIARYLESVYGDRFTPPQLLVDMVGEGRLGKKTGRGFFEW